MLPLNKYFFMLYAQHKTTKKRTTPATNLPPIIDQWGRLREKYAVTYSVGKITNLFVYFIIPGVTRKCNPIFGVFRSVCKLLLFIWIIHCPFTVNQRTCKAHQSIARIRRNPATTEIAGFLLWNIATL